MSKYTNTTIETMKTLKLYTSLRREDYLKINDYKKQYPTLAKLLIEKLKSKDNIFALRLTDVMTINSILFDGYSNKVDVYELMIKFNNNNK